MEKDQILRDLLVNLLTVGNAHMSFDEAVKNYPMEYVNTYFPNGEYTAWHLLEHIRFAPNDILEFIVNPDYEDKNWPRDYWPARDAKASQEDWNRTISMYHKDRDSLVDIINDPSRDLYTPFPWGSGQNIIKEIMTVSDHTAYHIGEFGIMRQVMGTWRR